MPRKLRERVCPACGETKMLRDDVKTCGCVGSGPTVANGEKPVSQDNVTKNKRTIHLGPTRIHTVEQLIEQFEIDTTVWQVKEFTARAWEMGFIKKEHKEEFPANGPENKKTVKNNKAGHKELFAISATFIRILSETENDGYIKDNVRLMKENRRVTFQLAAERRYRTQYIASNAVFEEFKGQLQDMVGSLAECWKTAPYTSKVPELAYPLPIKDTHTEDAVFLVSDWHCGDVIRQGDTSGFPEFNLPICGNRIGYVVRKVVNILTMHRAMYPIKKLYVWFGGDMGNGDLHDAPVSNSLFIGPQIHFTFLMAKQALEDLMQLTVPDPVTGVRVVEEIVCMFTCGNHMREATAKYMPMKYQGPRTFDWLIYQMLMEFIKIQGSNRISYKEEMSPYIFENIRGHRYGFAHGMQVGYRNSPDMQVKTMDAFLKTLRSLFDSPEFRRKNGLQGSTFSRMCIGDIHVPVTFPRLKSNASINGQNELGVNWGLEPIPAGQQLFGVTEKHLETWAYLIECSHIQNDAGDVNKYGEIAVDYQERFGRK